MGSGEVKALKASMRGARRSAEALQELGARVEALDPRAEIPDSELEDLRRLTSAHALAAQALRGLVETILNRRGKGLEEGSGGSSGEDDQQ
jgi:hypothetical protein